jgi:diguanylate cyclase (GGDEF)-like protein
VAAGIGDELDLDDVTGLLVRAAFEERARLVLAEAARSGEACVLVLATVSDAVAEHEGFHALTADTVMRALAGRIERFARTTDVVGRFGESQLAVLLRGVRTHSDALRIGRTVHEFLVHPPVTTPGEEIAPSVGCGIGFVEAGGNLLDLIEAASAIRWLEPATTEVASVAARVGDHESDLATMDEFRIGMSNGEVRSYAQPVVDPRSEVVVGYQGLARWHHRWLGHLEAASFVGMIADTALATQVDLYVTRETAAVLTLRSRATPLSLYVPVSRRLIADARTEQYLSEIVAAFSLGMDQVRLQLAPRLIPEPDSALMDALVSLRDAHVTFAITDVELAEDAERYAELGFGELQLSRHLTRSAGIEREARRVVDEIVRIAHDRGVVVTATGVDEPGQRDAVRAAGCDRAIGGLFGQPEPANSID